ncbi:MAG: WecB/TagA/CpsF family glycosyltransferase [Victivallaceae bacterium]
MKNIGKNDCAVVLGVPLFRGTSAEALDAIFEMVARGQNGNILVTMNVDFAVNAHHAFSFVPRNQPLLDLMRRSPLVTADGMPILLLAKLIGTPLAERVTGADMVPDIAGRAASCGARLYILGGNADNNARAMEILSQRYPGVVFAGCETPFVKLDSTPECESENLALCDRINAARPDILFVCLGNPKQELWSAKYACKLNVPVIIGVGGTFNFISGNVRRAPMWMQKSGLEWIYRIIQEPRRLLKRYMAGLVKYGCTAATCIFAAWFGRLFGRPSKTSWKERDLREETEALVLNCSGLSRLDNQARLEIVARRVEADLAGKPLKFEHLSRFAAFQLAAHRLNR